LEALYLHDDRIGPYLRAEVEERASRPWLHLKFMPDKGLPEQWWLVTHVLFPMHVKVRVDLGELREIGLAQVAARVEGYRRELAARGALDADQGPVLVETWIDRAHAHLGSLLRADVDPEVSERLLTEVSFSRYVGIIRIEAPFIDPLQVLIDTTSTERNVFAIAVVAESLHAAHTREVAEHVAARFQCTRRLIIPTPKA
jgi:hypothetical protein